MLNPEEIQEFLAESEHEDTLLVIEINMGNDDIVLSANNDRNDFEDEYLVLAKDCRNRGFAFEVYEYLEHVKQEGTEIMVIADTM